MNRSSTIRAVPNPQTVAAAYSVRPWAGATVSTPLRWSEVRRGLDPSRFTIQTMSERIAKLGDRWAGVLGPGIDLAKCLGQLERVQRVERASRHDANIRRTVPLSFPFPQPFTPLASRGGY